MIRAKEAKGWAKEKLVGVIDSFPTPYTEEGELDEEKLREMVRYHYEGMKSDGVYILGGAAETWFLSKDERVKCCEIQVAEARKIRPDAPILVGTLCTSARDSVELTRHAQEAGADAIVLKNPILATGLTGIYDFYRYVAENTDIPIALENIYGTGGAFPLSPEFLAGLARDIPAICAVKNTVVGNHSVDLKRLAGDNMIVSCFDSYALMSGVIKPKGLVDPVLLGRGSFVFQTPNNLMMREFCYACIEGDLAKATDIYFSKLIHLVKLYYEKGVISPSPGGAIEYSQAFVKYWAWLLGVPVGNPIARPPIAPLTDEQKERIRTSLVKSGLIKS
ncbi:dihydrodipicolinate synthase family protein [Chloroflexota bacterium]